MASHLPVMVLLLATCLTVVSCACEAWKQHDLKKDGRTRHYRALKTYKIGDDRDKVAGKCRQYGAYLAIVNDEAENEHLKGILEQEKIDVGEKRQAWIGLKYKKSDKNKDPDVRKRRENWSWGGGDTSLDADFIGDSDPYNDFIDWRSSQPDIGEKCTILGQYGWYSAYCNYKPTFYICETPKLDYSKCEEIIQVQYQKSGGCRLIPSLSLFFAPAFLLFIPSAICLW